MKGRVALLIDADNLGTKYRHRVERIARTYGELGVCVGFALRPMQAWTSDGALSNLEWGEVTRLDSGRNATDIELTVVAMDLLYQGKIDVFCIVSNDADYAALALRIRKAGKTVIGLGKERESAVRFREACSAFEVLDERRTEEVRARPETDSALGAELREIVKGVMGEQAREWTKVSVLGGRLKARLVGID